MRHQFVRLFLSILLISFTLILVQILILFIGNWRVALTWKNMVFEEFASSLRTAVESIGTTDESGVLDLMVNHTTERISGLLIRDRDGRFVLSLGASPVDEQLPSPAARRNTAVKSFSSGRLKLNYQSKISYIDVNIEPPRYVIDIDTIEGTPYPSRIEFRQNDSDESMLVSLPSAVADQDIAGTIELRVDGTTAGYMDVLVYRMNYYAPTLFAMKELLIAFLCSIPIGLIVAALLAAIVSKHNEKSVKELQTALSELSKGYYDVKLPTQNTEEMAQIGSSISSLGRDLERHQKSRKEWIRNISHDLNTPVAALSLLINGALDGMFTLDEKLLSDMKKENDTLAARIQSVGYYSFLMSPDAKAEKSEVSFLSASDDVLQKKGCMCIVPESDVMVYADLGLFERALCEVVQNAVDYRSDDEPPRLEASDKDGGVEIWISNHGHLPQPLPQFFEPWARGDASRTSGGSGLGLPIVYQIMELHEGNVRIEENDGNVTVTLYFPGKKES